MDSLITTLAFNYGVGTINHVGLRTENWTSSCALLAFPHCTSTQPYDALNADLPTINRIRRFVEGGGSFLGLCGGAYFASREAVWDGRRWGSAHLAFWPWSSSGPHLPGGAQTHEFILPFSIEKKPTNEVDANGVASYCDLHCDGAGEFDSEGKSGTAPFTLMGCYSTNGCAGVQCAVGTGTVVLWHAHLERSFRHGDVERGFKRMGGSREYDVEVCFGSMLEKNTVLMRVLQKFERRRFCLLRITLQYLNLQPAANLIPQPPLSPLPQFLITLSPQKRRLFAHLQNCPVLGEQEVFEFQPLSWANASNWVAIKSKAAHRESDTRQRRTWVICSEEVPDQNNIPLFNLASYSSLLGKARVRWRSNSLIGNHVLYGEAVTSTQTQLTL
jgi:biotin--protein ligase